MEANVALEDLESFLAAANELQIKGLTAPSVNQFKKSLSQDKETEPSSPQPPPSKKVKKEKVETSSEKQSNNTSRSVLKRRNTDSSVGEESRVKEEYKVQLVDPDLPDETFEQSELTPYDDSIQDYIQDADGSNYSLEDGSFSGTQGDTASEVKRLTDQYSQKVEVDGGVLWSCTRCGKQGKMKHHVREHIESNHIDCLTFNCPFCNKEIKNRVALRSHISKNHREENMRSKGHIF